MIGGTGGALAQSADASGGNYQVTIGQMTGALTTSTTIESSIDAVSEIDIVGLVSDSTLLVGGAGDAREIISANMVGNEATGTLTSSVNNDTIWDGSTSGMTATGGDATSVNGNLSIDAAQVMDSVLAVASQTSAIGISADDTLTSSLAVLNNVQESIGVMNRASIGLSSGANSTDATTAVVVAQSVSGDVDFESSLTVTTDAVASIVVAGVPSVEDEESQLTLAGNTQRAIGVANVGTNSVAVTANEVDADTGGNLMITTAYPDSTFATGANVLSSQQDVTGTDMLAEVAPGTDAFLVSVADGLILSALDNELNLALANLRGNVVSNTLTIDATNLQTFLAGEPAGGTVASLANSQSVDSDADTQTIARVVNGVRTDVGSAVSTSTINTSTNRIEAASSGNTGANTIGVTATNIQTASLDTAFSYATAPYADAFASIGLASQQTTSGSGEILATLSTLDGTGTPTDGAMIVTDILGDVTSSTIVSDGNALVARATGNEITASTNAINVSGTNVATSTGLSNVQSNTQQITAVVGAPGTDFEAGTPAVNFDVAGTASGGTWTNTVELTGAELTAAIAEFSGNAGYDISGGFISFTVALGTTAATYEVELTPGTSGAAATPQSGGVVAQLDGALDSSTVSVGGNMTSGSATGNIATNRTEISATNLDQGTGALTATATSGSATADHALANSQSTDGDMSTEVAASFAIDADLTTYDIGASDLSVSENEQFATTRGNVATNAMTLTATNMVSSGAVVSNQSGGLVNDLSTSSDMDVFAPAAMSNSTLALDGNRNEAVTSVNTATNSLTVDTANLTSISGGANASATNSDVDTWVATADFALGNAQTSDGLVAANASTTIVNEESAIFGEFETVGIASSTASLSDNVTLAEGTANRSTNSVALTSGAEFAGTGALSNDQSSNGSVSATADMTIGLDLALETGTVESLVSDSALSLDGNLAAATARGNIGTNALSVSGLDLTADGGSAIGIISSTGTLYDLDLSASHTVMNQQMSGGAVASTSTLTSLVDLEGGLALGNTLNASTLSVTGNGSVADSAGNVSANSLALNGGGTVLATGLVGNNQVNVGVISSTASSATGIMLNATDATSIMAASNSTLDVSGNQTVAQARANVSDNVLNVSGLSLAETTITGATLGSNGPGVAASSSGANFAVLNGQSNSADVSATVTSASYGVSAYNTDAGALNASSVGVSGNLVQASAAGNTATNLVNLAALNHSGGTAGIANSQTSSGDILASVTSAQMGSVASGSVQSGSIHVGGNTISSSAVGNSVASTILRN